MCPFERQWLVSPVPTKMALKKPPTARPVHEGGGSDSESEDEPPMKGMMQGANIFIDANGYMVGLVTGVGQKWGESKVYGKRWFVVPLLVVCWSFLQRTNTGSGIFSQNALISTSFFKKEL